MKRFYRIYTHCLTSRERGYLEFYIYALGGKYYYLNPNHHKYPCEWMIVKIDEIFSNFPVSPDYYHIITDSDFLKDCVSCSFKGVK